MVPIGAGHVTAYISETTWNARFGRSSNDSSLLELYAQNQTMIDAIVARKVNGDAHKSVVLMVSDL